MYALIKKKLLAITGCLLPVYGLCHVYFTSCLIHCMLINRFDLTICSLSSDHYIEGKKTVKKEKKSSTEE